jgi:hypothetical protein
VTVDADDDGEPEESVETTWDELTNPPPPGG